MAKLTPRVRAQAQRVYTLTDELQVRLRVLEESHASLDVQVKPASGRVPGAKPDIENGDIEALAFLVLMQAAKSAQDDLKAIMEGVKEVNRAKAAMRDELQQRKRTALDFDAILQLMLVVYAKQHEEEAEELLSSVDSMSEMGEMESLRMQMAMDRMSKMMSTLSNLLKKMSDTNSQIVQNLK
jgi:hypothetical protein